MDKMQSNEYSSQDICKIFDVTKKTLFKWEKDGKISRVKKDWRGWRIFSDDNVKEIKKLIEKKMHKNE